MGIGHWEEGLRRSLGIGKKACTGHWALGKQGIAKKMTVCSKKKINLSFICVSQLGERANLFRNEQKSLFLSSFNIHPSSVKSFTQSVAELPFYIKSGSIEIINRVNSQEPITNQFLN